MRRAGPRDRSADEARRLPWVRGPADVIARWPSDEPLCAIVTAEPSGRADARWSILARPVRDLAAGAADPFTALDAIPAGEPSPGGLPFAGGVIGRLSYDLGRTLESGARAPGPGGARDDRAWPDASLLECPGAYLYDHAQRVWWSVGDSSALPPIDPSAAPDRRLLRFRAGALRSATGRAKYESSVAACVERIRSGEVFQANIAHRLSASFAGSARGLFLKLLQGAAPRYGALVESLDPGCAVVSISPELLVDFEPSTRRVVTRPIKGTRPAGAPERDLELSEKDRAELTMIVDLMRNDLGRVCDLGSVRVEEARAMEVHGGAGVHARAGVRHGVATVSGALRAGVTPGGLLRAVFPAGSVTGAPKVRAMRVIDELEPVRRGPYCGSVGFLSRSGHSAWSVAIRTALVRGEGESFASVRGTVDYSVGAGIVADSDPAAEWRETLAKAATFRRVLRAGAPARARAKKSA